MAIQDHPDNNNNRRSGIELTGIWGSIILMGVFILLIGTSLSLFVYYQAFTDTIIMLLAWSVFTFIIGFFFILLWRLGKKERYKRKWRSLDNEVFPSDHPSQFQYLLKRVNLSVYQFETSTGFMFRAVRIYKYSTVLLSAASTIILGLNLESFNKNYTMVSKNIALVLSTLVTAITTMAIFWNYEKYWVQNKVIQHRLHELKYEIEFEMSKSATQAVTDNKLQELFSRYQQILRDFHLYWEGVLTEKERIKEKVQPVVPEKQDPSKKGQGGITN